MALKIEDYIASVRDFPIKGILFRDITPILENAEAFREVTNRLCEYAKSVKADMIVGIIDDLLATGGTAKATAKMIEQLGGVVAGFAFVIELYGDDMDGRKALEGYDIYAMTRLSDK